MNTSTPEKNPSLGVIIGRFQTAELHAGHRYLIDTAYNRFDTVLILVGTSEALPSKRNPLSFEDISTMLQAVYPHARILPLADHPSDDAWSQSIDTIIGREFPGHQALLFGSRDCFFGAYSGVVPVIIIPPKQQTPSGTELRQQNAVQHRNSTDFRSGIIWAHGNRPDFSYQAVDIALLKYPEQTVLLGKKAGKDGEQWRFIGGFVDASDPSLESAALRELREEAGRNLQSHEVNYLGSYRIDDPRDRHESDKVMTAFFATYIMGGAPQPGDDIDEVRWFPVADIVDLVVPQHRVLAEALIRFIAKQQPSE